MKKYLPTIIASVLSMFGATLIVHASVQYYLGLDDSVNGYVKIAAPQGLCPNCLGAPNNLSDVISSSTSRTNLGLGAIATHPVADFLQSANNLSDLLSASTARTNLGLGSASTHAVADFLSSSNNLSDVGSQSTARTNLGLGSIATHDTADFYSSTNPSGYITTSTYNANFGTAAGRPLTDFLASSTAYVANNLGNWAGTWQGVNSSTFYLASNPSGFLTTSTGLGILNFTTSSVGQWANNGLYAVSSSLGSAASRPLTDFLPSSTVISSYATSSVAATWTAPLTLNGGVIHNSTTTFQGPLALVLFNTTSTHNSSTILAGSVSSTIASALWSSGSNGVLAAYAGGTCTVGSLVTSISAAGAVSCNTTSSILTGYGALSTINTYTAPQIFNTSTTSKGWRNVTGTLDTVSACGATPTIVGTAGAGQVKTGTNATSTCTITFGIAPGIKPFCNVTRNIITVGGSTSTYNASTTLTTLIITGNGTSTAFGNTQFTYDCFTNI